MTADNRRKTDENPAKTEESKESFVQLPNSVMADKAERETTFLPSDHETYIATIESVVEDSNMKKAIAAVMRNKGAPGIDGITTEEIKKVMQKQ